MLVPFLHTLAVLLDLSLFARHLWLLVFAVLDCRQGSEGLVGADASPESIGSNEPEVIGGSRRQALNVSAGVMEDRVGADRADVRGPDSIVGCGAVLEAIGRGCETP